MSVKPGTQVAKEDDARAGLPERTAEIEPPSFVVTMQGPGRQQVFPLKDEPAARHAADLLSRAMELCGGGDPPEPRVGPIKPPADELRDAMKYLEEQIGNYGPVNFLVHERVRTAAPPLFWEAPFRSVAALSAYFVANR